MRCEHPHQLLNKKCFLLQNVYVYVGIPCCFLQILFLMYLPFPEWPQKQVQLKHSAGNHNMFFEVFFLPLKMTVFVSVCSQDIVEAGVTADPDEAVTFSRRFFVFRVHARGLSGRRSLLWQGLKFHFLQICAQLWNLLCINTSWQWNATSQIASERTQKEQKPGHKECKHSQKILNVMYLVLVNIIIRPFHRDAQR